MRRKNLKLFLVAGLLLTATACVKDVKQLTQNPFWLHGDFNPTLGVPVAYGEIGLSDILGMLEEQPEYFSIVVDETNDILTLSYDSSFYNHIETEAKKGDTQAKRIGAKDGSTAVFVDQPFPFNGSMALNIFESINDMPDSSHLRLQNVILNLLCHISADLQDNAIAAIHRHNTRFYLNNVKITALDKDRHRFDVLTIDDSIALTSLADGDTVHQSIVSDEDMAFIINKQPCQISYALTFHVVIPNYESVLPVMQFISDSLGVNSFDIISDLNVSFPVTGYINRLGFTNDLNVALDGLLSDDLSIDTAQLVLELENGLPLEMCLQAHLIDSMGNTLCALFPNAAEDTIAPARVKYNAATNSYVSATPQTRTHYITLNSERFRSLQRTKTIRLQSYISTSHVGENGQALSGETVTLRGQDALKLRTYLLAQPHFSIDTIINDSNSK